MQRYRATKIDIPEEALFPSAETITQYRDNLFKKYGFSPPVEYYVEGIPFAGLPEVGISFLMARDNRNGVKMEGIFQTSRVVAVSTTEKEGDFLFTTRNSIYKLEKLTEQSE